MTDQTNWPKRGDGICGIYAIENLIDGKFYVGQSADMRSRWDVHLYMLRKGTASTKLLRAWRKHGAENFRFFAVEECSVEDLTAREQAWIDTFDAVKKGYNISPLANCTRGVKHTAEARANMSKAQLEINSRPGAKERRVAVATKAWEDPDALARKSAASKKSRNKPEAKARQSKVSKDQWADPEGRERRLDALVKWWADPDAKASRLMLLQSGRTPEVEAQRKEAAKAARRASAILAVEDVLEIRARYVFRCPANGGKALAKEFGVSNTYISNIIVRKVWKDI
jgi:group I intron endonuclease